MENGIKMLWMGRWSVNGLTNPIYYGLWAGDPWIKPQPPKCNQSPTRWRQTADLVLPIPGWPSCERLDRVGGLWGGARLTPPKNPFPLQWPDHTQRAKRIYTVSRWNWKERSAHPGKKSTCHTHILLFHAWGSGTKLLLNTVSSPKPNNTDDMNQLLTLKCYLRGWNNR